MKMKLTLLALFAFSQTAGAASPPWYYARKLLQKTVGASTCLEIAAPQRHDDHWEIAVKACTDRAAAGLAIALKSGYSKDILYVVQRPNGDALARPDANATMSASELKDAYEAALEGNPYFSTVHSRNESLYLEFKHDVIQVFADNMADYYGMMNFVAAEAFSKVLNLAPRSAPVAITTSVKN
jgi:hypothetical protein